MQKPLLLVISCLSLIFTACSHQQPETDTAAPTAQEMPPAPTDKIKSDSVHQFAGEAHQFAGEAAQPAQQDTPKESLEMIIGTWLSEENAKWKLVFTSEGKCSQYYEEELIHSELFSIANTSPQCGEEVLIDSYTSYLQLEDVESMEKICYEINGITERNLSLRPLGNGKVLLFNRI